MMVRRYGFFLLAVAGVTLLALSGCTKKENPLDAQFESSRVAFQAPVPFSALDLNPLGDGISRIVSVAFASYDSLSVAQAPMPVLYLLHDFGGDGLYYDRYNLQDIVEEMFEAGEIGRMMVVTVGADNSFGGSFYRNSVSTGNYEDLLDEVIQYVENQQTRAFPAYVAGGKKARAISGHGMGGFGALRYAMEHPDMFGSVSSTSGPLGGFGSESGKDWLKEYTARVFSENNVPMGDSAAYAEMSPGPGKRFTNMLFGMSSAFSPRDLDPFEKFDTCYICNRPQGCPGGVGLSPCYPCSVFAVVPPGPTTFLFPAGTGERPSCSSPKVPAMIGVDVPANWYTEVMDSIWNLWGEHDVLKYFQENSSVFDDMDLYFDCGVDDEFGFLELNRLFESALQDAGMTRDVGQGGDYIYEEYSGYSELPAGHADLTALRLRKILKFHSDRFARPPGS